jgi:probable rRNA maturation factor
LPAFVSIRNGPFRDVSRAVVKRWAERMLVCLELTHAELSIAVTDDREIRELNKVFRHRDKPTDVLAFAMREGEPIGTRPNAGPAAEMLGDVVISVATARRQAKEHRRRLDREICMLLAHGLLHLVGYDHQTDRDEAVMNAETERLCSAANRRKSATASTRGAKSGRAAKRVRSSGSKSGTSTRAASRKAAR